MPKTAKNTEGFTVTILRIDFHRMNYIIEILELAISRNFLINASLIHLLYFSPLQVIPDYPEIKTPIPIRLSRGLWQKVKELYPGETFSKIIRYALHRYIPILDKGKGIPLEQY